MIGRLRGLVVERGLDGTVVLDVGGVGYELSVPLGTLGRLGTAASDPVTLHVHTHVREDALALFGFATAEDRTAFRTLTTVSSVGPKLALAILSHMEAADLADAIARQDATRFKGIPGVGKKIADRLVLELKDKLALFARSGSEAATVAVPTGRSGLLAQVVTLLVSMGFKQVEAELAVNAIAPAAEGKSVDALLKEALASMG